MGFEILLSLAEIQIIRYNLRGKRELLSIQFETIFLIRFFTNFDSKEIVGAFLPS